MYESLQANKASCDTKPSPNSSTSQKAWEPLVKPSVRLSRNWETKSIYKRPLFYVTAVTHLFFFYVFNLISHVAVDSVLGKGVPIKLTVAISPVASVFDCLGRVVVPMATEAGYVGRSTLITIDYAAIGVGLLILSFLQDFPKLLVTATFVGMFNGHATAVHSSLMADAVGTSQLRRSNNIVTCVTSLAFLTKPILIGTAYCCNFFLFRLPLRSIHFSLDCLQWIIYPTIHRQLWTWCFKQHNYCNVVSVWQPYNLLVLRNWTLGSVCPASIFRISGSAVSELTFLPWSRRFSLHIFSTLKEQACRVSCRIYVDSLNNLGKHHVTHKICLQNLNTYLQS